MKIVKEVEATLPEIIEVGDIVRTVHNGSFKSSLDFFVLNTSIFKGIIFCRNIMTGDMGYFSENDLVVVKKHNT